MGAIMNDMMWLLIILFLIVFIASLDTDGRT
jgi:hypothetical protein